MTSSSNLLNFIFQPRLATRERRGSSGYALSNKRDTSPKKNHSPARKSQQSSNTVAWNSRAAAQRTTSPKKGDTKRVSSGGGGGADRGRQATGRASRESRNKEVEVFNLADALGHIVGQVSEWKFCEHYCICAISFNGDSTFGIVFPL